MKIWLCWLYFQNYKFFLLLRIHHPKMGQNEPKLIYQIQNVIKRSKTDLFGLSSEVYLWLQFFQNVEVKFPLVTALYQKLRKKHF